MHGQKGGLLRKCSKVEGRDVTLLPKASSVYCLWACRKELVVMPAVLFVVPGSPREVSKALSLGTSSHAGLLFPLLSLRGRSSFLLLLVWNSQEVVPSPVLVNQKDVCLENLNLCAPLDVAEAPHDAVIHGPILSPEDLLKRFAFNFSNQEESV